MATLMQIRYLMMSIYIAIFSAVFIYGLEHFKVDSMRTMGIQFFLIFMTIFYWIIEYRTVKQWIGYREYLKKVEDLIRVTFPPFG
jgi:hypothetical protein